MAGLTPQSKAEERLRAGLLTGDEITRLSDPEPLIEDVLDLNTMAELFAPSGAGKSLIALDWALHIASGLDWWGRKTAHGPVLYVVAEGARGTKFRYEAWCEYHELDVVDQIHWMTVPANVLLTADRDALLRIVDEICPVLTVLDTLARHIPGGDENTFQTMSVMTETQDSIKRTTEGCALSVHHAGKDEERGSRGHSSYKGALDAQLSVKTARVTGQMICSVYAEKFKDREDHRTLYTAKMIPVGRSLVPVKVEDVDAELPSIRSVDLHLLTCLNGHHTPYSIWWKATGVPKATFSRAHKRLLDAGLVEGSSDLGWRRVLD